VEQLVKANRLLLVVAALWLAVAGQTVEAQPVAAQHARLDLTADAGELSLPRLMPPAGSVARMDWVPADVRNQTATVQFPVCDFAESSYALHFSVAVDTVVQLDLLGPWEPGGTGKLREATVDWLQVVAEGATLTGFQPGTAWHDQRISCRLACKAGSRVKLGLVATVPEDLRDKTGWRPDYIDSDNRQEQRFGRGVNVANFLEVPPAEDWGDNSATAEDYRQIAAEGFDHVRIPVGWQHYCGPAPDYRISPVFAERVLEQIDLATQAGLAAIVNVHHYHEFMADPDGQEEKLLAIWGQVATLLRERPLTVAIEILNEPGGAATTERINVLYARVVPLIRQIDRERLILVGPGNFNQASELGRLKLPADERLVVTVHTYAPHWFTHQGAEWSGGCRDLRDIVFPGPPAMPVGVPAGSDGAQRDWLTAYNEAPAGENPCSAEAVAAEIRLAARWGRHWNRPIHLGEFGVYTQADQASRARYCAVVRRECEAQKIGWCLWDWKASFDYWDDARDEPLAGMREALFGR
jgi:endoglucanase